MKYSVTDQLPDKQEQKLILSAALKSPKPPAEPAPEAAPLTTPVVGKKAGMNTDSLLHYLTCNPKDVDQHLQDICWSLFF